MMWTSSFLFAVLVATPVLAHESCCTKAAAIVGGEAPVEWIVDPNSRRPEYWDEEEDGTWDPPMIKKPLPGPVEVFGTEMGNSINDAIPWLLLGLLCTGVLQGILPSQDVIRRHLVGQGPVVVVKGALLGLASPLCSCGVLPLAVGLSGAGAAAPAIVAFIVAAQSAGIDSLFFTWGVLGPAAAAMRLAAAAIVASACGLAAPILPSISSRHRKISSENRGIFLRMYDGLSEAFTDSFAEVVPSILFGFVVTSALAAFFPSGGLAVAAALGGLRGRAAVLLVALPLQFCEHAAVPLAVALQNAGASGGLAFSVLATLPGVNMATFGVISTIAGIKGAVRVAFALWSCGLLGSFVADFMHVEVTKIGHAEEILPDWYVYSSRWIMGAVVLLTFFRKVSTFVDGEASACCSEKSCKSD